MLHHHSTVPYPIAASEAATHARDKMTKLLENGRTTAARLFEHVHTAIPADSLARGSALNFQVGDPGRDASPGPLVVEMGCRTSGIHRHAMGQIASKAGVPGPYVTALATHEDPRMRALLAHTLNEHYHVGELSETRHLCRSVGGELRGFLSDRYRRVDSRPLLDSFAQACRAVGAQPVEGTVTDTRVALKAYLPMIFEPVPNEVMLVGLHWQNSDFGMGRHVVRLTVLRLWCTNKAVMEDTLSQVHIGGQMSEGFDFSEETLRLQTAAHASALGDVIRSALGPTRVTVMMKTIKNANAKKLAWDNVKDKLGKQLLKREMDAVQAAFEGEDVLNLPAGHTVWRMSNALSWIAGHTEDKERSLELERLAGAVITNPMELHVEA